MISLVTATVVQNTRQCFTLGRSFRWVPSNLILEIHSNNAFLYRKTLFEFSTSKQLSDLQKLSRVRVVDNSQIGAKAAAMGKRGRIIHVYTRSQRGTVGDKVLLAIAGEKKHGYIVGVTKRQRSTVPRYDDNLVVLVEPNGTPSGTRVTAPVPTLLRRKEGDFSKILAIATHFVWSIKYIPI